MEFNKVLNRIKTIKVQGAENIAIEAAKAFYHVVHSSKALDAHTLIGELKEARSQLFKTRPTEPCMRNTINYVLHNIPDQDLVEVVKTLDRNIKSVFDHFRYSKERISVQGANKIKNGYVVFTHCHSSSVVNVLLRAHKKGIKFSVHNTEARPLLQGRKTAYELAKAGIPVEHYIDSAARIALKKSDICLFGADAIQSDGKIINKIGTELFLEIAEKYELPVFFCTDSWKFDPKSLFGIDETIEKRHYKEIWKKPPPNVKIINFAFEIIDPIKATGIISELGIYRPGVFVEEVKNNYSWMFK